MPIIVLVQLVLSVMIAQQTAHDRFFKLSIVPLLSFRHEQYYLLGWQQCEQLIDMENVKAVLDRALGLVLDLTG